MPIIGCAVQRNEPDENEILEEFSNMKK